jgi:hypothetical protein
LPRVDGPAEVDELGLFSVSPFAATVGSKSTHRGAVWFWMPKMRRCVAYRGPPLCRRMLGDEVSMDRAGNPRTVLVTR